MVGKEIEPEEKSEDQPDSKLARRAQVPLATGKDIVDNPRTLFGAELKEEGEVVVEGVGRFRKVVINLRNLTSLSPQRGSKDDETSETGGGDGGGSTGG